MRTALPEAMRCVPKCPVTFPVVHQQVVDLIMTSTCWGMKQVGRAMPPALPGPHACAVLEQGRAPL